MIQLSCLEGVIDVEEWGPGWRTRWQAWNHDRNEVLRITLNSNPVFNEMWFLTVDPLIRISVFIAKLSERYNCWRILEDFHSQEYIQFFDVHCGLFMRLHFSIGCYDYRRTTRLRQGIHFSGIIQVLSADHMHRRAGVNNKFSFLTVWDLMQAGTYFPKVRRMLLCFSPFNFRTLLTASTLLHGHLALATLSLPETDPQILEHWGCADEVHLGKSFRAKDFGLECLRDVHRFSWILHIGSVSVCLSSSVKSMKTSAAPYPWNTQPNCRVFDEWSYATGLTAL